MEKIIRNIILGITAAVVMSTVSLSAAAQNTWTEPPVRPGVTALPAPPDRSIRVGRDDIPQIYRGGDNTERSIKVDSNVNLSLCVTQGNVKVNGWSRNEIRVLVDGGSKFWFKVLQKSTKTGEPVWLMVAAAENKNKYGPSGECIWGGEIEIDVPVNATINIKGRETTTKIDTVRKVNISTIGGDISLRNISSGITASAGQGDITVEESEGSMMLDCTTGNILVFEAGPSEIGDTFKAKTNSGEISLQHLEHRQIEVNSISGSVAFNGELLPGGSYSLSTSKGSIRMSLPAASSCNILATYGYGSFNTEIPIKIATENITEGPIKTVVGTLGKGGDATLKLTSNNGSIGIKKQ
ncbi:hypothetical protein BH10ACI3_BH10ACI3_18340 [soil metagenome]